MQGHRQTQGDGGEFALDYTVNGSGQITQTDVTNPRGFVRPLAFNSAWYVTSDAEALGETIEQTTLRWYPGRTWSRRRNQQTGVVSMLWTSPMDEDAATRCEKHNEA